MAFLSDSVTYKVVQITIDGEIAFSPSSTAGKKELHQGVV